MARPSDGVLEQLRAFGVTTCIDFVTPKRETLVEIRPLP